MVVEMMKSETVGQLHYDNGVVVLPIADAAK